MWSRERSVRPVEEKRISDWVEERWIRSVRWGLGVVIVGVGGVNQPDLGRRVSVWSVVICL